MTKNLGEKCLVYRFNYCPNSVFNQVHKELKTKRISYCATEQNNVSEKNTDRQYCTKELNAKQPKSNR